MSEDEEPYLPYLLSFIIELRLSGNVPEQLLKAFQYVLYYGTRREAEVGQGTSKSLLKIVRRLVDNFCISYQ